MYHFLHHIFNLQTEYITQAKKNEHKNMKENISMRLLVELDHLSSAILLASVFEIGVA